MATKTIAPTIDAVIEGIAFPDSNFGAANYAGARAIYIGADKTFLYHSLGNFDVSALAADTINSASLWMYHYTVSGTPSTYISRNTRPSTWVVGEVTWNSFSTGNAWTAGGGDVDDVTPTVVTFSLAAGTGWQEVTGLAGHVTDAIASRSNIVALNIRMVADDPGTPAGHFWHATEYLSLAWYLRIDYTPASPAGIPFERPSRATRALLRR